MREEFIDQTPVLMVKYGRAKVDGSSVKSMEQTLPQASQNEAPTDARATRASRMFPGSPDLSALASTDGRLWRDVRRTLDARYSRIWMDIAGRYLCMFSLLAISCGIAAGWGNGVGLLLAPVWAVGMGFWFATIVLFMHEAAHYNLASDKARNDRLANGLVCLLIGDDIRHYRALHWKHHLKLGEVDDSEVSYHYAPDLRFALETLCGVHAWRVFQNHRARGVGNTSEEGQVRDRFALVRGLSFHAMILGFLIVSGFWSSAVAWVLAVGVVFPYLSALRQQLEHRSLDAGSREDFARKPHGAINRMFARTVGARAFGSAGFWRHLLHHWDPTVSYTRYDDLEDFLMGTPLAEEIDEARTSYLTVWRGLVRQGVSEGG